jgi:diguanylate cyclase (GGDEF)-like protein
MEVKKHAVSSLEFEENSDVSSFKYHSVLQFINLLVMEIDLDLDRFSVVSFGGEYMLPITEGEFGIHFVKYITGCVYQDDVNAVKNFAKVSNIIALFYRGENSVSIEFRAKHYDSRLERFTEDYVTHKLTFCRVILDNNTRFLALGFLQKTQPDEIKPVITNTPSFVTSVIKSMQALIYELNFKKNKVVLLHNNLPNAVILQDGVLQEQLNQYIGKTVYKKDKDKIKEWTSPGFIDKFFSGSDNQLMFEFRAFDISGELKWYSLLIIKNTAEQNSIILIVQDITEAKHKETETMNTEIRINELVSLLYIAIFEIDFEKDTLETLFYAVKGLSYPSYKSFSAARDTLLTSQYVHLEDIKTVQEFLDYDIITETLAGDETEEILVYVRLYIEGDFVWHMISLIRDATEKNKAVILVRKLTQKQEEILENRKEYKIRLDRLTLLYNKETILQMAYDFYQDKFSHGLLVIDIDNLNDINESYGREYGDLIIGDIANLIQNVLLPGDLAGRIGGDEFMILMRDVKTAEDVKLRMYNIKSAISEVNFMDNCKVTASGGAALFPLHGNKFEELYYKAETALRYARSKEKGRFEIYGDEVYEWTVMSDEDNQLILLDEFGTYIEPKNTVDYDPLLVSRVFDLMYGSADGQIDNTVTTILSYIAKNFNLTCVYLVEYSEKENKYITRFDMDFSELNVSLKDYNGMIQGSADQYFADDSTFILGSVALLEDKVLKQKLEELNITATVQSKIEVNGVFKGFIGFDDSVNAREWTSAELQTFFYVSRIIGSFYFRSRKD